MLQEFRDRVRKLRAENLFNVRKISGRLQKLRFIKNALFIEMSGLTSTDIINIIEEVEEELRMEAVLNECDVYEKDSAVIIEAMLKDVIFCPVCNVILNQNVACDSSNFCEECTKSVSL